MNSQFALRLAAIFGFLGVALGAFGAHGLKAILEQNARVHNWETAVFYHLVHATVLVALAMRERISAVTVCLFATGIVIFSGTLYALALTNLKWLGAITPLGGLCLLAGWLTLILKPR